MHGHTTGLWPRNEKDIEVTDYPDLIARLRETAKLSYPTATPDEAADALEKQARRIAELEYDATYHESNDEVMMRDIEYYRARIAELEAAADLRAARAALEGERMSLYDDEIYAELAAAKIFWEKKASEMTLALREKDARIAELEAALKPFADYSLAVDWEVFTPEMHFARSLKFPCGILYADLRAARKALGEKHDNE